MRTRNVTKHVQVSLRALYADMEAKATYEADRIWRNTGGCRVAKTMCSKRSRKLSDFVLSLQRKDCRLLTCILTVTA